MKFIHQKDFSGLKTTVGVLLFSLLVVGFVVSAQAQQDPKRIAITIDDLPLNGPDIGLPRMQAMTSKFVAAIKRNGLPAVGFVNESWLYTPGETDSRIALLRSWIDAGVELGNHTYSHLGFKGTPLSQYEDDFVRGDTVSSLLMKNTRRRERFYRHPFLQMGDTPELERSFEDFISARGYRVAPVTIDSLDWLILAAYQRAKIDHDMNMMRKVSNDYLKYVGIKLAYCEEAAEKMFGRHVDQIMLLHANELNADNFERLLDVFRKSGYRFITLEEALKDPIYGGPEKYFPTSDWLANWAANKSFRYEPPSAPDYLVKIYEANSR